MHHEIHLKEKENGYDSVISLIHPDTCFKMEGSRNCSGKCTSTFKVGYRDVGRWWWWWWWWWWRGGGVTMDRENNIYFHHIVMLLTFHIISSAL